MLIHKCIDVHKKIYKTVLQNYSCQIHLLNVGACLEKIMVKDKSNQWQDIVLGYSDFHQYLYNNEANLGCVHALLTNRVGQACFSLDGKNYYLNPNEAPNALHIGNLKNLIWDCQTLKNQQGEGVIYTLSCADRWQGLPGPITISVEYWLTPKGQLRVNYISQAYQNWVVSNLTNHSYFNLNGNTLNHLDGHYLQLFCSHYLPTDAQLIPTGHILAVQGDLDFRTPKAIALMVDSKDPVIHSQKGYDLYYLQDNTREKPQLIARLASVHTGISMNVFTNYPGLQLYSANFLNDRGKNKQIYSPHDGLCLETHDYPDALHHDFPCIAVAPNQKKQYSTIYEFSQDTHWIQKNNP